MLLNLLKLAIRNLYRDRLYSFLNLAGLAVSYACFLVIYFYLFSELTTDQHVEDHENIYRLTAEGQIAGSITQHAKVGRMIGPLLAQDYAQFEDYVRLLPMDGSGAQVIKGDIRRMWPSDVMYNADNSVFAFFGLDIIAGNAETALTEPRSIAISESVARFYFGDEDPIGQTLGIQLATNPYTVVLVFADLPENTSHRFDMLFSNSNSIVATDSEEFFELGIMVFNSYTFFRLPAGYDPGSITEISNEFYSRYISSGAQQMFSGQNLRLDFQLQPLDDIYLSPPFEDDIPKGNPVILYALSAVAIFILGIASINYMNLSTARFSKRAREVGVRRTLGADRRQLIYQFLTEGMLFSLLALLIGVSIAEVFFSTSLDSNLLGQDLSFFAGDSDSLYLQLLLIGSVIGLISGSYPAFYFSSVRTVDVFKPIVKISGFGITLRSILIGLQTLVSISVIAGALIMYQQVSYMKNRPLGFEQENKLVVRPVITRTSDYRTLMTELNRHPDIYNVTMTDQVPGTLTNKLSALMQNNQGEKINMLIDSYVVDENYLETFSLPLVAGRNFPAGNRSSDEVNLYPWLVNETLVAQMGWDDPIGQEIAFPADGVMGEVIGVVADFNFSSLREEINPLVMHFFYDDWRWGRYLVLDINPDNIQEVIAYVKEQMATLTPESPFEYSFLDETLAALYGTEQNQAQLILTGSGVCIIIAFLGLFGLTAFTIEQKTKEIGIRRILGASTLPIMTVMFRGIFALTIASGVIASVLVLYSSSLWLQGFAYRISISPVIFISAVLAVLVVSILTIAIQSVRVAGNKPVEALRYE